MYLSSNKFRKVIIGLLVFVFSLTFILTNLFSTISKIRAATQAGPVLHFTTKVDGSNYNVILSWNNPHSLDVPAEGAYFVNTVYMDDNKVKEESLNPLSETFGYTHSLTKEQASTSHVFFVTQSVVGGGGSGLVTSNKQTVNPTDFTNPPPDNPTDPVGSITPPRVAPSITNGSITLLWDRSTYPSCDDTGSILYHVFKDGQKITPLLLDINSTTYTDKLSDEDAKIKHTYYVTTVCTKTINGGTLESKPSNTVVYSPGVNGEPPALTSPDGVIYTPADLAGDNSKLDEACNRTGGAFGIVSGWISTFLHPIEGIICALLYYFDDLAGKIANLVVAQIAVSDSQQFKPGGDYYNWIAGPWKIILGITDIFVVVVLLFLAIVNILHIKYDTYQLKKSLPLLIIGAIMANFSLLICRMVNDVSEVLVGTFTNGGDVWGIIIRPLFTGIGIQGVDAHPAAALLAIFNVATNPGGLLFLVFIMLLIITITVLIFMFLLYIRLAMMVFLFIVAPFAFVGLAFPPTSGLFKLWWSTFIKWVFMKPIMFFILFIAATIADKATDPGIIVIFIVLALIYMSFIIPFKLGGTLMSSWAKFGQWATGTGKGGYARKPLEESWGRQKQAAKGAASNYFYDKTRAGRWMGARKADIDALLKHQETEKKGIDAKAYDRLGARRRSQLELRGQTAEDNVGQKDATEQENINRMEAGENLEGLENADYQDITGKANPHDAAQRFVDTKGKILVAQALVKKRRELDAYFIATSKLEANTQVRRNMDYELKTAQNEGRFKENVHGVTTEEHDSEGNERGKIVMTLADLKDSEADFSAKGKTAHGEAQKRFYEISTKRREAIDNYINNNRDRYDYDAVLDRNAAGRMHSIIAPFISSEVQTEHLNTTGYNAGEGLRMSKRKNGQIQWFGTSEIRGTDEDAARCARGEWDANDPLANSAFVIKRNNDLLHMAKGLTGRNPDGTYAMNDFYDFVQESRDKWDEKRGEEREFKANLFYGSLEAMTETREKQTIQDEILRQAGSTETWEEFSKDRKALNSALRNLDVSNFTPGGPTALGRAHTKFLARAFADLQKDEYLKFAQTVGVPITAVPTQGDPHPVTNPIGRNRNGGGGSAGGGGETTGGGGSAGGSAGGGEIPPPNTGGGSSGGETPGGSSADEGETTSDGGGGTPPPTGGGSTGGGAESPGGSSDSTAEDIRRGFQDMAQGANFGAMKKVIENMKKGPVIFRRHESAEAARKNPNYHTKENPDGGVEIIGVLDPETDTWFGVPPPGQ